MMPSEGDGVWVGSGSVHQFYRGRVVLLLNFSKLLILEPVSMQLTARKFLRLSNEVFCLNLFFNFCVGGGMSENWLLI